MNAPAQNVDRMARIRERLTTALTPFALEVIDDSHKHVGHVGARDGRGHFTVRIVSSAFQGAGRVARHRLVYEALGDMLDTDIHALSIQARAPDELD